MSKLTDGDALFCMNEETCNPHASHWMFKPKYFSTLKLKKKKANNQPNKNNYFPVTQDIHVGQNHSINLFINQFAVFIVACQFAHCFFFLNREASLWKC